MVSQGNQKVAMPLLVVLLVAAAGCVAGSGQTASSTPNAGGVPGQSDVSSQPGELEAEPGFITGLVVDPELVPIPDVTIAVTGETLADPAIGTTDAAGAFKMGPFPDGTYLVTPEKRGYKAEGVQAKVGGDQKPKVRLTIEPVAGDVPYHETLTKTMFQYCGFAIYVATPVGGFPATAPCGYLVDYMLQTATQTDHSNSVDDASFNFKIQNPGFQSLVMEMVWPAQQFMGNGLLQLTELSAATVSTGGLGVATTNYGGSMAQPFHDVIHAGKSYWVASGKNVTFYPEPNATKTYQMVVAGDHGNTSIPAGGSAVYVNYKPTVYLTFFYNRQAQADFTILPDQ